MLASSPYKVDDSKNSKKRRKTPAARRNEKHTSAIATEAYTVRIFYTIFVPKRGGNKTALPACQDADRARRQSRNYRTERSTCPIKTLK